MRVSFVSVGRAASRISALVITAASVASGQRVVLPAGSVIIVRTTDALRSSTARAGQAFETTVDESVGIDNYTAIPSGSRVRGLITLATPANRQQSGVIEVTFNQLRLPDGSAFQIVGKLTSTDSAERRQIKADPNSHVVLVGARTGFGAAIAGAGASKGTNNILSALGGLLSAGSDVDLPAGTPLAVEFQGPLTFRVANQSRRTDASSIYTAPDRVRAAQQALARWNYYRGTANGTLDDATRRALFQFQVDRGLGGTGNLDTRTALALGLNVSDSMAGAILAVNEASTVRRNAQSMLARGRTELGASDVGRLNPNRAYDASDLELWFALSAFSDNASLYEQVVRNSGNRNAAVVAGRALVGAARRVDAALQAAAQTGRTSLEMRNSWATTRQLVARVDTP